MSYFDLRHVALVVLNILKSQTAAMPGEWDPFTIATHFTWLKFWLLFVLLFVFSFVSIGIASSTSYPTTVNTGYVRVQIKNVSFPFLASFLALMFFPQILFWYAYFVIIVFFLCYSCISNMFSSFIVWTHAVMSAMPVVNIYVTTNDNEEVHDGEDADVEEGGANTQVASELV